jgi:hypothetical protein
MMEKMTKWLPKWKMKKKKKCYHLHGDDVYCLDVCFDVDGNYHLHHYVSYGVQNRSQQWVEEKRTDYFPVAVLS